MYYILSEMLGVVAELFTYYLFVQGIFYKRDRHWLVTATAYGVLGSILLALSFLENGSVIRMVYCIISFAVIAKLQFSATVFIATVFPPVLGPVITISVSCVYMY